MYHRLLKPILFRMEAEAAHRFAITTFAIAQDVPIALSTVRKWCKAGLYPDPVEFCGIPFHNRVGLAAGFDKHAEVVPMLEAMGFGFVEVGTVLPDFQEGNERPRIFRVPEAEAIINRMGFNSEGMHPVKRRLLAFRKRINIPIGVSLGKMKSTPNSQAHINYATVLTELYDCGDYFVINVSSPNTEALRELQTLQHLERLVRSVVEAGQAVAKDRGFAVKPILVKLDPDLMDKDVRGIVSAALAAGASGFIATNTTTAPARHLRQKYPEKGGWSGSPVAEKAVDRVRLIRSIHKDIPIIGVGGIDGFEAAARMREAGANLIQLYTGFIYQGPALVMEIREGFAAQRERI